MEFNIEEFNPNIADLKSMVEQTKDLNDNSDLEQVKAARVALGKVRTSISKRGKELREDAIAFQKSVIGREKELIEIIEPEEDRLEAIENAVKEKKERERRALITPQRQDKLSTIGDDVVVSDDELTNMDDARFFAYYNGRVEEKNRKDRAEIEEAQKKIEEERNVLNEQKALREAEERGRVEAEEKARKEADEKVAENKRARMEVRIKLLTMRGLWLSFTSNAYVIELNGEKISMSKGNIETQDDLTFQANLVTIDEALLEWKRKTDEEATRIKEADEARVKAEAEMRKGEEEIKFTQNARLQALLKKYNVDGSYNHIVIREENVVRLYTLTEEITL